MSHASQVSQSGMTPGGESIGQGSGDHQSSELDGSNLDSDRDENHRSVAYNARAFTNSAQVANNTVQNTPLKHQEITKATHMGKGTPTAPASVLGKREARNDVEDKNAARKKARKEAQKPQDKGLLLKDLFDEDG